jgi:hypothetical protein
MNSETVLAGTERLTTMTKWGDDNAGDWADVADEVEAEVFIKRRFDRICLRDQEE